MIQTTCPKCNEKIEVPDSLAGKTEACPKCKHECAVPALSFLRKTWNFLAEQEHYGPTDNPQDPTIDSLPLAEPIEEEIVEKEPIDFYCVWCSKKMRVSGDTSRVRCPHCQKPNGVPIRTLATTKKNQNDGSTLIPYGIALIVISVLCAIPGGPMLVVTAIGVPVAIMMILCGVIFAATSGAADKICNAINAQKPKEKP